MNIQRYILPASIAAVMHTAFVLIFPATPSGHAPAHPKPPTTEETPFPIDRIEIPPEDTTADDQSSGPVGEMPQPPVMPDLSDPSAHSDFPVDVTPAPLHPDPYAPLSPPKELQSTKIGPGGIGRPIFNPIQLDKVPRTTSQISPDYPHEMKVAGISGRVVVEFVVDTTGRVMSADVISSTQREFEAPTLRAVLRWRFEPGKRDGRAVPFRMQIPVDFAIDET